MPVELSLNAYQQAAMKTAASLRDAERVTNGVLGLMGESGELARYILSQGYYPPNLETMLRWCVVFGGVADAVKKAHFQGHDAMPYEIAAAAMEQLASGQVPAVDDQSVSDPMYEVGDALWYVAIAADGLGHTLGDVAQANLDKLGRRYPDGFSAERSRNRTE